MSSYRSNQQTLDYIKQASDFVVKNPMLAQSYGKRIAIFVVTYNAITTLESVLERIPPLVYENVEKILIFDDASQDKTYELAVELQKSGRYPEKFEIFRHPKNLGYGGNQKAGYLHLIKQGFDVAVLLHGDGQYAPEFLSTIYHPLAVGEADAVFGSRMMSDFGGPLRGGMPVYKFVGNKILTTLSNFSLKMSLTEFHSGYRAYNLKSLSKIRLDHLSDDFHFDTEIIIKLRHQGMRVTERAIPTFYGDEICRVNGLKYAKNIARALLRYHSSRSGRRTFPEFAEYSPSSQ